MNQNILSKNPLVRYPLGAVAGIVGAFGQHALTSNHLVPVAGLLYPATFLTAWFLGLGPALVAIVIGMLGTDYLNYEPPYSFKLLEAEPAARLAIFALTSLFTSWVVDRGRKSQLVLAEANISIKNLQNRFERSAVAMGLGVWYCDLPFDVLIWNREVKEHFWLPPDAHVTIDVFYERIHPDDRERTRKAIARSIESHETYDIEYRTTNPADTSQVKVIRAMGWTDYDASGKAIRFDGVTLDNTETRSLVTRHEQALEVLNTVNDVSRNLSAELEVEKLVQKVTDAATHLSGAQFGAFFYNVKNEKGEAYTLYSISGVPRELFSKFPMPRNTEIFAPTFVGSGILRSDDITKDPRYGKNDPYHGMPAGHLPVVSYLAVPVISRSGEVIGGLFFGHPKPGVFTQREENIVTGLASQAAIAMDNARLFEKARQAIHVRDEFLSISSHELRTPLTPLKIQLQNMLRHIDNGTFREMPDERVRKMVVTSERQVTRLTTLVEDLLDVSRISSGRLKLNFEDTDLSILVQEVVERYQPQLLAVGCRTEVRCPPSLPAKVDRLRVEQVLINFLTNAMRYAPDQLVEVELSSVGPDAVLSVQDHGMGISAEDQQRIFGRFERILSTTNYGGLGLGLYIAQQIVQAHQGTIQVESELGKGARFQVKLPLYPA
jgi:signal transduction histidine kinase/PAS domain-containing protein